MKKHWRITLGTCGAIAMLAVVGAGLVEILVRTRLHQKFETHRMNLPLPAANDAASIDRGQHLVSSRFGCGTCHGANLGGGMMLDNPAIAVLPAPNLTTGQGSRTTHYALSDWDRIVRHGVKPDGSAALMPSEDFFRMSDAELLDIVTYIRSLPPIDHAIAAPRLGLIGKVLLAIGKLPLAAEQPQARAASHLQQPPEPTDTLAFGAHLATVCRTCHRADFAGGTIPTGPPDWPKAANLTRHATGLAGWTYEDFDRALVGGVRKDGHRLREPMASVIASTRTMQSAERMALWAYLSSLAPTATH